MLLDERQTKTFQEKHSRNDVTLASVLRMLLKTDHFEQCSINVNVGNTLF